MAITGIFCFMNPGQTFLAVAFIIGIVIGVIGLIGVSVNYPIYKKLLENGKQKYAFDIMQLAKEISEAAE